MSTISTSHKLCFKYRYEVSQSSRQGLEVSLNLLVLSVPYYLFSIRMCLVGISSVGMCSSIVGMFTICRVGRKLQCD